jgi:DNA-binding transcriptional ArsR family regulator
MRTAENADERVATLFAALSEPIRIQMLRMMLARGAEDIPCTLFDHELAIDKAAISYHVGILHRANLISVREAGGNYRCGLRIDTLESCAPALLEHLRKDHPADR